MAELFLALIHHPVLDRNARVITSAITSLDIHDIARSARTYEVRAFFLVHPVAEQREFARSVIDHWLNAPARNFDFRRRDALGLVRIVEEIDNAVATIAEECSEAPRLIYTSARADNGVSFDNLRVRLRSPGSPPHMLMLGTGFGLAPPILERADIILEPVRGAGDYNHLSVRAAASIILDRLRGR